jgi:tRNA A22 N-methylase
LVDPSEDVINTLTNRVNGSYITRKHNIKIHKIRGQEFIPSYESKCIVIAGMGGKEIGEILIHLASYITINDRIVISPHRNILELRDYLFHSEYRLFDEVCLNENGQFYQILCLQKSGDLPQVSLYGDKLWADQSGKEYLKHLVNALKSHQDEGSKAYLEHLLQLSC